MGAYFLVFKPQQSEAEACLHTFMDICELAGYDVEKNTGKFVPAASA